MLVCVFLCERQKAGEGGTSSKLEKANQGLTEGGGVGWGGVGVGVIMKTGRREIEKKRAGGKDSEKVDESDLLEGVDHGLAQLCAAQVLEAAVEHHVLARRERLPQDVVLRPGPGPHQPPTLAPASHRASQDI
jgi:hypothetical protein